MDSMRRNVELKASDPDPARSLKTCLELGAKDEGWLQQRDTYLDVPSARLKIRQEGVTSQLIYYERADSRIARKSRYQIVDISQSPQLREMLIAALGAKVIVEKRRRLLLLDSVRIHLDDVSGLGHFIEIEAVADAKSDLTWEHKKVTELEAALAITAERRWARSYSDALLDTTLTRSSPSP
jgi:predicted adenylyl cyclase CyaB